MPFVSAREIKIAIGRLETRIAEEGVDQLLEDKELTNIDFLCLLQLCKKQLPKEKQKTLSERAGKQHRFQVRRTRNGRKCV